MQHHTVISLLSGFQKSIQPAIFNQEFTRLCTFQYIEIHCNTFIQNNHHSRKSEVHYKELAAQCCMLLMALAIMNRIEKQNKKYLIGVNPLPCSV